jgi:hypothetical protein
VVQIIDAVPDEVAGTLEREFGLIREAIALVANGTSPRVTLASLRLSSQLLEPARHLAAEVGVRVVPLWHADEDGVDISIERETDGWG